MPEPFSKTISVVKEGFLGSGTHESLLVNFSPGTICFLAASQPSHYAGLEVFDVPGFMLKGHVGADTLLEITQSSILFKGAYRNKIASCFSQHWLMVPNEIHNLDYESLFRTFVHDDALLSIQTDLIRPYNATGIYAVDHEMKSFLDSHLHNFSMVHAGSLLIEQLTNAIRNAAADIDSGAYIAVNIKPYYFDIMMFEQNTLTYYHTFYYEQFDDILYYTFYLLNIFDKEPSAMRLFVAGELDHNSDNFTGLSRYFKHVEILGVGNDVHFADCFDEVPLHYYLNLLNVQPCE